MLGTRTWFFDKVDLPSLIFTCASLAHKYSMRSKIFTEKEEDPVQHRIYGDIHKQRWTFDHCISVNQLTFHTKQSYLPDLISIYHFLWVDILKRFGQYNKSKWPKSVIFKGRSIFSQAYKWADSYRMYFLFYRFNWMSVFSM